MWIDNMLQELMYFVHNLFPQYSQLLSSYIYELFFLDQPLSPQPPKSSYYHINIKMMKSVEKAKVIVPQTTK